MSYFIRMVVSWVTLKCRSHACAQVFQDNSIGLLDEDDVRFFVQFEERYVLHALGGTHESQGSEGWIQNVKAIVIFLRPGHDVSIRHGLKLIQRDTEAGYLVVERHGRIDLSIWSELRGV